MARRSYDVNEEGSGGQRRGRRKTTIKVCMLDDSVVKFDVEGKEKGDVLYKQVYEYLNLEECDYFGLHYYDKSDNMFWLDQHKAINKQIHDIGKVLLRFSVKFYAPDPAMLQEEYTRYMFSLQVKRDLLSGRLKCSESTAALLASYIVQGELGDFDSLTCRPGYLAEFQFFPEQNQDSEGKIAEFHKQHRGLSPSDCDYNLLDVARRLEMYGIILYPARDKDNVELDLAAANMGILVFQSGAKINTLSWAKIRKLSFKRKRFLIKLHPEIFGHYKDVVEFQMGSRDACKSFWKVAISTHAFFRQSQSQSPPKHRPKVFSRGSSYRFSGRTQKQIIESTMENSRQQPAFNRTQSLKTPNKNSTPRTSQSTARPYGGFGNADTRVVESTPIPPPEEKEPRPETPEKDLQIQEDLLLENGTDEMDQESDEEELHEHGPVIKVQSAENPDEDIPLKDLDHEPDMMRDESSVSSVSQPDLEWQEELISEHPPQNEIKYMTPNIDSDREVVLPPGAVETEYKPQPRPPTPIEVDGIESPPPPPPPEVEEEEEEISSKEFKPVESAYEEQEEFPAPPMETLPSPPPELLRDSPDPDRMDEEPSPVVQTNGYHEQKTSRSLQITCTSVKVQNGEVNQHGKGSSSSRHSTDDDAEQRDGRDNVFEEQVSPMFRSDTEASPPASPTMVMTLKSEETLSKSGSGAAYTIAKELLNTERTYVKDLEVITISFREVVSAPGVLPDSSKSLLFSTIDPIYDFHCTFLAELEERMALWDERIAENAEPPLFGDLMLRNMKQIKRYVPHLKRHDEVMLNLENATKKYKQFDTVYKEFETQKVCYLPLNAFLVKPSQRLLHYKFLLERILKFCPTTNPDYQDLQVSLEELGNAVRDISESMKKLENVQKLIELQRDLIGVDGLVQQGRDFVREGCLQRIARKGPQPRMFFLFSDLLLYTCKGVTVTNQFRVQGQIPLHTVKIEDVGPDLHGLYPFTITFSNKHMVVAAQSEEEKYKWLEDLNSVVSHAKEMATCSQCMYNRAHHMFKSPNGRNTKYFCEECYILVDEDEPIMDVLSGQSGTYLEHNRNLENGDNQCGDNRYKILPLPTPVSIHRSSTSDDGSDDEAASASPVTSLDRRHAHSNTMSTRRVCWHRNTSISMSEHALSVRNHMSGDLLRKFKTGNRWQKLWVVFTNFCLFFYKNHQDDFPLASLPLIGYLVDLPAPADQIDKELVFKLQYKSHVYFFRADNEYSFFRWMEVISSATQSSTRARIFSRMESQ